MATVAQGTALRGEPVSTRRIRQPDWLVQMLGMLQVPFELAAFLAASPTLPALPRGDGHPVLVLPGLMGGDSSTLPLRNSLESWGYEAHGWGRGNNPGPTPGVLIELSRLLREVHGRDQRRVSLIGWSMGGRFARHLARQHPDMVRQVVTLAAPLQFRRGTDRSSISFLVDRLEHTFAHGFVADPEHVEGPLPVPSTSIYSRTDGVVRWHGCLDVVDDQHENVEVFASHVGVGLNPSVLFVIANRLAQAEDDWQRFQPPVWLQSLYPPATSWNPPTS